MQRTSAGALRPAARVAEFRRQPDREAMHLRTDTLRRWWPTTQSLDLVEGPVAAVAAAVEAEVVRFLEGEAVITSWEAFASLDAAFRAAPEFANVPTFYLVLPSRSRWTVLWNNSFLCDGYDSLCWCLTKNHRLTTVHWSAHDQSTTFQVGAAFCHRRWSGTTVVERSVQVAQEDERWSFRQSGQPLPEEDVRSYGARRKRERLDEALMAQLLARLGATPWSEEFYAVPEQRVFVLRRARLPAAVIRRPASDVVRAG
jgi:hypothetical protein